MKELLNQIGTVQSGTKSGVTAQFTMTHAAAESSAQMRLLPLNQARILSATGSIPTEVFQLWVDADVTISLEDLIVLDSVTYKVLSVETYGTFESPDYHKCVVQRMLST